LSKTPSPSVSGQGQPAFSFGPVGHLSSLSAIPSLSVSGHLSMQLNQIRLDKHHLYQQRHHHQYQDNHLMQLNQIRLDKHHLDSVSISIRTTVEFLLNQQRLDTHHLYHIFHHRQYLFLQI
jgi:hypothetical protein